MLFSLSETDCKWYGTQIIGLEGFLPFRYDLLVSAAASGAEPLCEENLQKNLVRLQSHAFCLWWSKSTCRFGRAFTFRLPVLLVTVTASPTSGQNLYLKSISANSVETHNHPFALHEAKKKVFMYVETWMGLLLQMFQPLIAAILMGPVGNLSAVSKILDLVICKFWAQKKGT